MANILLHRETRNFLGVNYKLADFGLAHLACGNKEPIVKRCGTPSFMAPEVIDMTYVDYSIDIWSLAIVT